MDDTFRHVKTLAAQISLMVNAMTMVPTPLDCATVSSK